MVGRGTTTESQLVVVTQSRPTQFQPVGITESEDVQAEESLAWLMKCNSVVKVRIPTTLFHSFDEEEVDVRVNVRDRRF
jgi:hypothetical protein